MLDDAARPRQVADQRVRCAVVGRRRPVQLDRRVRGHGQAIGVAAVQRFAVPCRRSSSGRIARAQVLGAEIRHGIRRRRARRPDRHRVGEIRHEALRPPPGEAGTAQCVPSLNGGEKTPSYLRSSQACASRAASVRIVLRLLVGLEWLSLLDADRLELIDHDLVARRATARAARSGRAISKKRTS